MDYPRKWTKEFLSLYRALPSLWDVDHPHYKARSHRHAAYVRLRHKYREVNPSATIDMVKRKLQNCRSAYRRELRRTIQSAQAAGEDEEAVRVPHLWYFSLLSFLHEKELQQVAADTADSAPGTPRGDRHQPEHRDDETHKENYRYDSLELEENCSPQQSEVEAVDHLGSPPSPPSAASSPVAPAAPSASSARARAKKRKRAARPGECGEARRERDRFDAAGENIAFKLRELSGRQRIMAEKLIYDVLYEAELGNLNGCCRLLTADTIH